MKAKESALAIEQVLNDFGFDPKATADVMATHTHRTLQQSFTRLCLAWLKKCASEDYRYDDRNEMSHVVAKILLEGHDDLPGLPFI